MNYFLFKCKHYLSDNYWRWNRFGTNVLIVDGSFSSSLSKASLLLVAVKVFMAEKVRHTEVPYGELLESKCKPLKSKSASLTESYSIQKWYLWWKSKSASNEVQPYGRLLCCFCMGRLHHKRCIFPLHCRTSLCHIVWRWMVVVKVVVHFWRYFEFGILWTRYGFEFEKCFHQKSYFSCWYFKLCSLTHRKENYAVWFCISFQHPNVGGPGLVGGCQLSDGSIE